ncbi:AAA family ATPase [Larkinella bovis]|uniref:AAA family ATPase n=1 Tax=Larkinella bovis TaxID=683041 RepID=A0ABW0I6H7_9BACT
MNYHSRPVQKVEGQGLFVPKTVQIENDFDFNTNVKQQEPDHENYSKIIENAEINLSIDEAIPPTCFTIESGKITAPVGTLGNFSIATGKAKSRKTTGLAFFIGAAISGNKVGPVRGHFPEDQRVVVLADTEQSRYHVQRSAKRALRLVGSHLQSNLKVYAFRKNDPRTRLKSIEQIVYNTPNLGLLVIDGIRDLAQDPILEADQANEIITHLMKWSEELRIHIIGVIHQNKSDSNIRGHLGTEAVNKAETVFSVAKNPEDKETSIVSPEYCRDIDFEPFVFGIDETSLPYLVDDWKAEEKGKRSNQDSQGKTKKNTPEGTPNEKHIAILIRVYEQEAESYGKMVSRIKAAAGYYSLAIGDNAARDFMAYYIQHQLIHKVEQKPFPVYALNADKLEETRLRQPGTLVC